LDRAEAAEANGEDLPLGLDEPSGGPEVHEDAEEGEIDEDDAAEIIAGEGRPPTAEEKQAALRRAGLLSGGQAQSDDVGVAKTAAAATTMGPIETTTTSVPPAPQQDQTLENIKMAYYWAGYYSGLYDGQRQSTSTSGQLDGVDRAP
jgi:hypothetical protein